MSTESPDEVKQTVALFVDQPSTDEQKNTVEELTSDGYEMQVLTRWYPTNPQGMYSALYYDEAQDVLFSIEVNSLDETDFALLTTQVVADELVRTMTEAR